jgi:hypothetical protein
MVNLNAKVATIRNTNAEMMVTGMGCVAEYRPQAERILSRIVAVHHEIKNNNEA